MPDGLGRALRESLARARAVWRANLDWQSIGLRHAARTGVATTLGFLAVRALHLPVGYWATMAILLSLQPSIATSWPRSLERAAGSIVGGAIAAAIGLAIHSPLGVSIAVFPLVVATMAFRSASYSLFVLFLTPTFVLVAGFATPGAHELSYALARLLDNVLGCAIAFGATFLLWPSRGPDNFREALGEALSANLDYLARALGRGDGTTQDLDRLRRAAGLASNRAEEAMQRARLEALRHSGAHWIALTALALCRRLAGTATRARLGAGRGAGDEAAAAWIDAVRVQVTQALGSDKPGVPSTLSMPSMFSTASVPAPSPGLAVSPTGPASTSTSTPSSARPSSSAPSTAMPSTVALSTATPPTATSSPPTVPSAPAPPSSRIEADALHQVRLLVTVVDHYVSGAGAWSTAPPAPR